MNSKTPLDALTPAVLLWSLPFIFLVIIQYIKNAEAKSILMAVIYPLLISFISRNARFWVKRSALSIPALITLLYILLITSSKYKKNQDAIVNPTVDKTRSGLVFASIIVMFMLIMFLNGVFVENIYDPSNFS